jgi:hypothetical protein
MNSTSIEGDEGAGVVPRGREKSADAPAPGEPAGMTLAAWIERRRDQIVATLTRDAAPAALRELRRLTPPRGVAP